MAEIKHLLEANAYYAHARASVDDAEPSGHIAVVTCMDARIDTFAVLGLHLGEAHVIRNAGGRVTPDVLRSLALSVNVLGVRIIVVMQHTCCGLASVSDDELRAATGADLPFFPIDDHHAALREDCTTIRNADYLSRADVVAGFIYDVNTGVITESSRWERS